MDISKIILRLQQIASTSSDSYELMVLAKAVEKLKVGSVSVVSTIADVPSVDASAVGEIYLVEADDDLYVNVGSQWNILTSEKGLFALAWGYNSNGRLGDGTSTGRSSPVSVVGGITDWTQVSAGNFHTVGIRGTGVALAWGRNSQGQLGDGTTSGYDANPSPVSVVGGITDWTQVSAGGRHCVGITAQGVALAWGNNSNGRLGDGTPTQRSSPVSVVGSITDWTQVSAGYSHTVGIRGTGVALAWGRNNAGQLGDGTTTDRSSPVSVVGGITDWTQVSAGRYHTVGITAQGVALAWGNNSNGQLGDGTTTVRASPVSVVGGITDWTQVSAGTRHCVGIRGTGVALAWGRNNNGQLGNGASGYDPNPSPVSVVGGITNWTQVSAGSYHCVGITAQGVALAWGRNSQGQLGNGATSGYSANPSPVSVVGGITDWTQVSAGQFHCVGTTFSVIRI